MSDDEIRIAIAEHCGWMVVHGGKYVHPKGERFRGLVVDPLEDLNAMHEAEAIFDSAPADTQSLYYDHLSLVCGWKSKTPDEARWESTWNTVRATARQRAEAFLRTVGKWKE